MTQLLVAHVKLKMIHKLTQKFNPCVNMAVNRAGHEQATVRPETRAALSVTQIKVV